MDFKSAEAKVTIAKLIELAYSSNKGVTAKIIAKKGNVKLTVDQNGNAILSGSAGIVTFSGTPVLEKIGAKIKRVSVNFSNKNGQKIVYSAVFDLEIIQLSVVGTFSLEDLEELMTSCSGLICRAVRSMMGRGDAYYDNLWLKIM